MHFGKIPKNIVLQALIFGEAGSKDTSGRPTDGVHLLVVGDYILQFFGGKLKI